MHWTKKEDQIIKRYYSTKVINDMQSLLPNRTANAIISRAAKLGSRSAHFWSQKEMKILKENYSTKTPKQISKLLPTRTVCSIQCKAEKLKLISYKSWTKAEDDYLKDNYANESWEVLIKTLKRSKSTICAHARKFNLVKENRPNRPWLKEDIKYLEKNYAEASMTELIETLNKPKNKIIAVANNRNLTRNNYNASFLEDEVGKKLQEIGIDYKRQYKIWKYRVDFYVENKNTIIEIQGNYWHCNPNMYKDGPTNEMQKDAVKKDKARLLYFRKMGYNLVFIWEKDFHENWEEVEKQINVVLNGDVKEYDSAKTVNILSQQENTVLTG